MDIVVTDTNILIDLLNLQLTGAFFELPIKVHTLDLVLSELWKEQRDELLSYCQKGLLEVHTPSNEEVVEISNLLQSVKGNLSFTDCSALFYAMKNAYILLTGDRQLRNKAQTNNIQVRGILYIFDQLVSCHILSQADAVAKLEELRKQNVRLPKDEIAKRIKEWMKV